MAEHVNWTPPPLSKDDERLVSAYLNVGRPLDDLPYTDDFDKLAAAYGAGASLAAKHDLFRRLLRLRKQGRLPRITARHL